MNKLLVIISVLFVVLFGIFGKLMNNAVSGSNDSDSSESGDNSDSNAINPKLVIEKFEDFNVVRDDLLTGGTKQRGAVPLFSAIPQKEIIYVSPTTGFAQIALSLAAKLTGKKAIIYMAKERPLRPQTIKAKMLGGIIREGKVGEKMASLRTKAEAYINEDPENRIELYLGLDLPEFKDALETAIREAVMGTELEDVEQSRTFWVVGGSAILARVLAKIFINSKFNVVQVGRPVELPSEFTVWIAPESFYEDAKQPPPFPSVLTYDAKVWQFAKKHGKPGDYIWNVAADPIIQE